MFNDQRQFRTKSFFGEEKELLVEFKTLLENHFNQPAHLLCAHNGKEFDFPYIARRMIIQGIELPAKLNLFNKKPWEVPHLDTMHLWRFGDYKHYTSLSLMAHVLGIPTPKDEDPINVFFFVKNPSHLAAIYVIFGGGNAQHMSHQRLAKCQGAGLGHDLSRTPIQSQSQHALWPAGHGTFAKKQNRQPTRLSQQGVGGF